MADSQTVSTATDFPIEWANPEDARIFWTRETMHFPEPIGPLTATFEVAALAEGMEQAVIDYSLPTSMPHRVFNGYVYSAIAPRSADPAVLADLARQSEEKMRAGIQRFESDWKEIFLPELERDVAAHRAFDYAGASDAELARHIAWTTDRRRRQTHIHFSALAPGLPVGSLFLDAYRQLAGSTDEMEPHVLLQGLPNRTVEGGHALWRLGRMARKSPSVRQAIEQTPPEELLARLEESPEGREFAEAFRAYLDEFGWRGDSWNMDDRTWVDYPKTPQDTLRAYLLQPDEDSPELAHARLAAERERALAALRGKLSGAPAEARAQFEWLLHAAQFANQLQEDHNYIIDQKLQHLARRAFVEAGKRMVARGQIADPEDVLFLTLDELRSHVDRAGTDDLRTLVERRRADLARQATMTPPPAIGTPPPPPPPGYEPSPFEVAMMRFFGGPPPPSTQEQIRGNAGSKGKVSGVARVATTLAEATSLQPGEVLVCPTTAPPWTPLFAVASAVVTDTGGILSHCAVVAREYGIPAVVGTGVATQRIRTGQRITVDGAAGTVTLE